MLEAYASGLCAASASLMGKLSGTSELPTYIGLVFFALMIIFNVLVWTFYVRALNKSANSLTPTMISAATNFVSSAFMGMLFFGESTSVLWWSGATLIILGLTLISKSNH